MRSANVKRKKKSDNSGTPNLGSFKKLLRNITVKMIDFESQRKNFAVSDLEVPQRVLGHWMSLILVSGPGIKITFKAHFMTKLAQILAAPAYGKTPDRVTEDQGLDFMREFCNLSAGGFKKSLLNHQIKTGVSIPIVTRGFDEIFFPQSEEQNVTSDFWMLKSGEDFFYCSVIIEVYQDIDFSKISENLEEDQNDQGNVEFL